MQAAYIAQDESALEAVNQFIAAEAQLEKWQPMGCFYDNPTRRLPNRGNNVGNPLECATQAEKGGYDSFGLQYGGECWLGSSTQTIPYNSLGTANCYHPPVKTDKLGGTWTQQIYSTNHKLPNPAIAIPGYDTKVNTDYGGNDIVWYPTSDAQVCASHANETNYAKGFTVATDGSQQCWVKGEITNTTPYPTTGRQTYVGKANTIAGFSKDTVTNNRKLLDGMSITSSDGRWTLRYTSKILAIYANNNNQLIARINNGSRSSQPGFVIMQSDGNLVEYTKGGQPMWDSCGYSVGGKHYPLLQQNAPYRLTMQNDRNLCIYDKNNQAVWCAGTALPPPPPPPPPPPNYLGDYTLNANMDFPNYDLGYYNTSDPQQCATYAHNTPGSLAFTVATNDGNQCWVKGGPSVPGGDFTMVNKYPNTHRQTYIKNQGPTKWTLAYSRGQGAQGINNYDIGEAMFNSKFINGPQILLRKKFDGQTWETIYYKRISPISANFSMYQNMINVWGSANNLIGKDFNMFSTLNDVQSNTNPWAFCNYDDSGAKIGGFRDCGPTGGVPWNWVAPNSPNSDFRNRFSTGNQAWAIYILEFENSEYDISGPWGTYGSFTYSSDRNSLTWVWAPGIGRPNATGRHSGVNQWSVTFPDDKTYIGTVINSNYINWGGNNIWQRATPPQQKPPGTYTPQDFVTWTANGTDLPNQPMTGTVKECSTVCDSNQNCVGFSWSKGANPNNQSQCWLKQNINTKSPGQAYQTYVRS